MFGAPVTVVWHMRSSNCFALNMAGEVADLLFHNMVLLSHLDMSIDDVLDVLEQRFGTSGHEEKATRQGT